jgi:heparanase 1
MASFNHTAAAMASKGRSAVYAFEFSNEVYAEITPKRYSQDMLAMKSILAAAWAELAPGQPVPKLVGPDNGGDDMSAAHLEAILSAGGAEAMHAATYHDYWNECIDTYAASAAAAGVALNASCIDDRVAAAVNRFGPTTTKYGVGLWVGEGALHASSGVNGVTNTFVSSLWYAHTLGQLARNGVGMLARQTLLGGDYELVNRTTGAPNPDYYVALLWHDLVGSDVLNVTMEPACQRNGTDPASDCAEVHIVLGLKHVVVRIP